MPLFSPTPPLEPRFTRAGLATILLAIAFGIFIGYITALVLTASSGNHFAEFAMPFLPGMMVAYWMTAGTPELEPWSALAAGIVNGTLYAALICFLRILYLHRKPTYPDP